MSEAFANVIFVSHCWVSHEVLDNAVRGFEKISQRKQIIDGNNDTLTACSILCKNTNK